MRESLFYDNGGVRVTKTMFEVPGTQFPIRNIGAVKTRVLNPDRRGPIICIVIGFFFIAAYGLGLLLMGLGIWWWMSQKPGHCIVVVSGGSDVEAYGSQDASQIREIQSAINAALAQL